MVKIAKSCLWRRCGNLAKMSQYALILLFLFTAGFYTNLAFAGSAGTFDWMEQSPSNPDELSGTMGCLEVPEFLDLTQKTGTLDVAFQGQWVATGVAASAGKTLQFKTDLSGLTIKPRKYMVMYRIDPRFQVPQIFIQIWDYAQNKYVSDFHQYLNGEFINYQNNPSSNWPQRATDYSNYFSNIAMNLNQPSNIYVYKNEVVNITLVDPSEFFSNSTNFTSELDNSTSALSVIYTQTGGFDNEIFYSSAGALCSILNTARSNWLTNCTNPFLGNKSYCTSQTYQNYLMSNYCISGKFFYVADLSNQLLGKPSVFSSTSFTSCPQSGGSANLCTYDKGRGMRVVVGNNIIKTENQSFIHSNFSGKDFLYYRVDSDGLFYITTGWSISSIFTNFNQYMADWSSVSDTQTSLISSGGLNFLHFGRYTMMIEIGSGEDILNAQQMNDIRLEYFISPDSTTPSSSTAGTSIGLDAKTDAPVSGNVWVRIINPHSEVQGLVKVNVASYNGSNWFSNIVYNKIIQPLQQQFNTLTKQLYNGLVSTPVLQRIARSMLILYVSIYALAFLAGAVRITVQDIVTRVIKIGVIVALFSPQSWNFFNDNLFQMFVSGNYYLFTKVIGVTSSATNLFGFVDPIIDRYTNGRVWALLFIQLLQIHNGLTVFAIITIYALVTYFRALVEVIVSYCLAFVGLAVMISLAPFFLTFLLFEQTKTMFNNWLSTLFNYALQPTILLIFFLLMDQMMTTQIAKTVVKACWSDLMIPIEVNLNLGAIGGNVQLTFPLISPKFFVPQLSQSSDINQLYNGAGTFSAIAIASLLFYSFSRITIGVVDYVTELSAKLTNVAPVNKAGERQALENPSGSVMNDLASVARPFESAAKSVGRTFNDKVINQNYRSRPSQRSGDEGPNYSSKISSGERRDNDQKPEQANSADAPKQGRE